MHEYNDVDFAMDYTGIDFSKNDYSGETLMDAIREAFYLLGAPKELLTTLDDKKATEHEKKCRIGSINTLMIQHHKIKDFDFYLKNIMPGLTCGASVINVN